MIPRYSPLSLLLTKSDDDPGSVTNMATTSVTWVGNSAVSPEPILRPSPGTGYDAEMLEVSEVYLGDDGETFRISGPNGGWDPPLAQGRWEGDVGTCQWEHVI